MFCYIKPIYNAYASPLLLVVVSRFQGNQIPLFLQGKGMHPPPTARTAPKVMSTRHIGHYDFKRKIYIPKEGDTWSIILKESHKALYSTYPWITAKKKKHPLSKVFSVTRMGNITKNTFVKTFAIGNVDFGVGSNGCSL